MSLGTAFGKAGGSADSSERPARPATAPENEAREGFGHAWNPKDEDARSAPRADRRFGSTATALRARAWAASREEATGTPAPEDFSRVGPGVYCFRGDQLLSVAVEHGEPVIYDRDENLEGEPNKQVSGITGMKLVESPQIGNKAKALPQLGSPPGVAVGLDVFLRRRTAR